MINKDIKDMNLPDQIKQSFLDAGYASITDLRGISNETLLRIKGISVRDVEKVRIALKERAISEGVGKVGSIYGASKAINGKIGIYRVEAIKLSGKGERKYLGIENNLKARDNADAGFYCLKAIMGDNTGIIDFEQNDLVISILDIFDVGITQKLALLNLVALSSLIYQRPTLPGLIVLGDITLSGTVIKQEDLIESLQVCVDNGAKTILLPMNSAAEFGNVPPELLAMSNLVFYSSPEEAINKALDIGNMDSVVKQP